MCVCPLTLKAPSQHAAQFNWFAMVSLKEAVTNRAWPFIFQLWWIKNFTCSLFNSFYTFRNELARGIFYCTYSRTYSSVKAARYQIMLIQEIRGIILALTNEKPQLKLFKQTNAASPDRKTYSLRICLLLRNSNQEAFIAIPVNKNFALATASVPPF